MIPDLQYKAAQRLALPADPGPIPAIVETWQTQESSAHRLDAKVPHDPQRYDARPPTFPRLIRALSNLKQTTTALTNRTVAARYVGRFSYTTE